MTTLLEIIQIITASGLIVAIYNNYSQIKLQNKLKVTEIKENRFRSILIFMDIMLHPELILHTSEVDNPLLKTIDVNDNNQLIEYYKNKIKANKANLYLYADDKLIQALDEFIENPSESNYITVAEQMKQDLWT